MSGNANKISPYKGFTKIRGYLQLQSAALQLDHLAAAHSPHSGRWGVDCCGGCLDYCYSGGYCCCHCHC